MRRVPRPENASSLLRRLLGCLAGLIVGLAGGAVVGAALAHSETQQVRLATTVRSSRSIDAVADLRQRLAPHQGSTPVADFFDLANTLLPT